MRALRIAVCLLLAYAGSARAWDPDSHAAIARAALLLSPAAAARIPDGQTAYFIHDAREADLSDRACLYHVAGSFGRRDPAVEVEKLYTQLLGSKGLQSPYPRSQALGRYVHFVADCVTPETLLKNPNGTPTFFRGKDFVVFREPLPLRSPLAERLRQLEEEAQWDDPGNGADTARFRFAVNLVVDALLVLPPVRAIPADEPVPILVAYNPQTSRVQSGGILHRALLRDGSPLVRNTGDPVAGEERLRFDGEGAGQLRTFFDQRGLHLVEWRSRRSGSANIVRVLLYNNGGNCVADVRLRKEAEKPWKVVLPLGRVTPHSFRTAEFLAPLVLKMTELTMEWRPFECKGPFDSEGAVRSDFLLLAPADGKPPDFDTGEMRRVGANPARD